MEAALDEAAPFNYGGNISPIYVQGTGPAVKKILENRQNIGEIFSSMSGNLHRGRKP